MLVLTRRPGEAIFIGDGIELMIVEVDGYELEARCALSVCDADGNDLATRHTKTGNGVTAVTIEKQSKTEP